MWDDKPRDIECGNEVYLDDVLPIVGIRLFDGMGLWGQSVHTCRMALVREMGR